MPTFLIHVEPLTQEAFEDFGDVIEASGREPLTTNQGTAEKYSDLARVDVTENGGRPMISVFRVSPAATPVQLRLMERHPIASQAFIPLAPVPFLVVVAPPRARPEPKDIRAFLTDGRQGVNYRRGTWHHPALAIKTTIDFLVLDRGDQNDNYDEINIESSCIILDYK